MIERTVPLGPGHLDLVVVHWHPSAAGVPLVVLHGFLEQGAAWAQVAEHLDRPVFAPDQRGHGRSGHVGIGGFYHFWDYVSDLDLLLEQLSPDAPVDLLGHSMGGTVACLYAGSRPERIRRLVLAEGLGPPDTEASGVDRARQFLAHQRNPPTHGEPFATVAQAVDRMRKHNRSLTPAEAERLAARQLRQDADGLHWAWDPRHRSRSPTPFVERQFVEFLERITAPTLVVYGADSPFPGIERAQHLRDHRIERVPAAGHLLHHDQPAPLATLIESHLREA